MNARRFSLWSSVFSIGAALVACSAPSTLSERALVDLDPAEADGLDSQRTPPKAAPPSDDELAHGGVTDVVVPDTGAKGASDAERSMGIAAAAPTIPTTVFVNGAGGTYYAGTDDSSRRVSSVLSFYGRASAAAPATSYSGATWQRLVQCIGEKMAPYNVTITNTRPAGAHTEIVVTNAWGSSVLGLSNGIGGIAPLGSCRAVPQAVGFVFQPVYDRPGYGYVEGACEAAAHELAHTLSLSHEQLSTDLMSYAPQNPAKRFQDANVACGVSASAPEACSCGGATQNSHRQLLSMVGPRSAGGGGGGGGGGATTGDTTAPTVSIVSPANGASMPGNANVTVVVDADDDRGLSDVRLVWQQTGASLACDDSVQGVTCVKSGKRYTWTILAGTGARSFYAYAIDGASNTTATTLRTITLTGAAADRAPTVAVQLPVDRTQLARGGMIDFQATVSDDRAVADVRAIWTYNGGSLEYPMAQTTTPGVYRATTTVSTTAASGWRAVEIAAVDDAGQRTVSAKQYVYIP